MKKIVMMAAVAMSLVGCGNVCDRLASASSSLDTKSKGCSGTTTTSDKFNKNSCDSALSKCSADDIKKLTDYASCLEGVPTCSGDGISWALTSVAPCAAKVSGLSTECSLGL